MNEDISLATLEVAKKIKLLVLDVDGVLTDGCIYYSDSGTEYKAFHVHDGLGIKQIQKLGIHVAVVSSRQSLCVTRRLQELGIQHVYLGEKNKLSAFLSLLDTMELTDTEVAYVGDDLPDLPVLQRVALPIVVANAHASLLKLSYMTTTHHGGHGAVREVCDFLIRSHNIEPLTLAV